VDLRDACFDELCNIISEDKRVFILTPDHGAFGLDKIKELYSSQVINVGISEQNFISVAAGLASCGKTIYAYGINNFIILRCLEQINVDVSSMNLHVNLIGVGAGFTYSVDGFTHQGTQDVGIMMNIPNFEIFNCSDSINTQAFCRLSYDRVGPNYIRIGKGEVANIYDEKDTFQDGFKVIKEGKDCTIISSGSLVHISIEAAKMSDLDVGVIDLYRLTNIDKGKIINSLMNTQRVLVVEDNLGSPIGDRVSSILYECDQCNTSIKKVSIDQHCFRYDTRENLHEYFKIDSHSIFQEIEY